MSVSLLDAGKTIDGNNIIIEDTSNEIKSSIDADIDYGQKLANTIGVLPALYEGAIFTSDLFGNVVVSALEFQRSALISRSLTLEEQMLPFIVSGVAREQLMRAEFAPIFIQLQTMSDLIHSQLNFININMPGRIPNADLFVRGMMTLFFASVAPLIEQSIFKFMTTMDTLYNSVIPGGARAILNSLKNYYYGSGQLPKEHDPILWSEWLNSISGKGGRGYENHLKSMESINNPFAYNNTYNWAGPGTNFTNRIKQGEFRGDGYPMPKDWSMPINSLDEASFRHDFDYSIANTTKARQIIDNNYVKELKELLKGNISTVYKNDIEYAISIFDTKRKLELLKGEIPDLEQPRIRFNETNFKIPDEEPIFYKKKKPKTSTKSDEQSETIDISDIPTPDGSFIRMPNPRPPQYIKTNGKRPKIDFLPLLIKLLGEDKEPDIRELAEKVRKMLIELNK